MCEWKLVVMSKLYDSKRRPTSYCDSRIFLQLFLMLLVDNFKILEVIVSASAMAKSPWSVVIFFSQPSLPLNKKIV